MPKWPGTWRPSRRRAVVRARNCASTWLGCVTGWEAISTGPGRPAAMACPPAPPDPLRQAALLCAGQLTRLNRQDDAAGDRDGRRRPGELVADAAAAARLQVFSA